jgi:hypothetical protein
VRAAFPAAASGAGGRRDLSTASLWLRTRDQAVDFSKSNLISVEAKRDRDVHITINKEGLGIAGAKRPRLLIG